MRATVYSPVEGSYKFSPRPPSITGTAMAARIRAAKVQGVRKGDLVDSRREAANLIGRD